MADALGNTLDWAMRMFFPLITRRLRSDQDPWINAHLEKLIERRKKIFKIQGRSRSWKKVKRKTEELIRDRKRGYLDYQVEKAVEKGGLGNRFAALTKPLQSIDKKPNFDVKTLCAEGASDFQAANECAEFFGAISDEFTPLDISRLPSTYSVRLPYIDHTEVARRLRVMRKPRSMVPGDIFPQLVSNYSTALSLQLADIFNAITTQLPVSYTHLTLPTIYSV